MNRDLLAHAVRATLKRLPAPYDNHYGVVPSPPPEDGIDILGVLKSHEGATRALATVDALSKETGDPYLFSRVLTRREAVSSSSIEGTNSTLDELLAVEEGADDQAKDEARQVRDYAVVLDRVLRDAKRDGAKIFTLDLLTSLHAEVMKSDPKFRETPGQFRSTVVWIGGPGNIAYSTWNPPPPEDIEPCLRQTVDYLRNEGMQQMTQSLVTRMAVAHAHFEAVHPFVDGNGRVGRMLLPLMMAAEGHVPLYLSPYIDANKTGYYSSLKAAQQQLRWDALVGFLSDAIVKTVDELLITRKSLGRLRHSWLTRRRFRKGSAALRALDLLPHFPVVTAKRLADMLKVSAPQIMQALAQLEEARILKERTGYARNRIFAAEEALAVINRPFGEPPMDVDGQAEPDAPETELS